MLANTAEWKHLRCSLTTQAVNGCVMVVVYFIHDLHAAGIRCTSYQHPSVAHGLKESYGHLTLSLKMCQGCGTFHDLHFLMISVPTPDTQVNLWSWRGTMAEGECVMVMVLSPMTYTLLMIGVPTPSIRALLMELKRSCGHTISL